MPENGAVTLPVRDLREWLDKEPGGKGADQTLEEVKFFHFPRRSVSTLRDWCTKGRFPHAYKLGRTWMVPRCCIDEIKQAPAVETERRRPARRESGRRRKPLNTSAWRDA